MQVIGFGDAPIIATGVVPVVLSDVTAPAMQIRWLTIAARM